MPLPPRQQAFVVQYLVDRNATQAAIRAGYSPKTAEQQGSRLLSNAKVKSAVDAALVKQQERVQLGGDDVIRELWRLATVDIGQAFDGEGRLKPLKDIPEDVRRAIAGVETSELYAGSTTAQVGLVRKVRFWSKPEALNTLAKHFKLLTDRVQLEGPGLAELVLASMKPKPPGGGE